MTTRSLLKASAGAFALALALPLAAPAQTQSQTYGSQTPAYARPPANYRAQGGRYYAPAYSNAYGSGYGYAPGYNQRRSVALRRFQGYYVNGRNPYWPTGRNIPMAKPWLPPR